MKILFLTEGGQQKGLGHITRCSALAAAAKRLYPDAGIRFVVDPDPGVKEFLPAGLAGNVDALCWREVPGEVLDLARGSDMAVIDSYLAGREVYESISGATCGRTIMIDDYGRLDYPPGIVVNPSAFVDKEKYLPKDGVVHFLGSEFIVLREEFREVPDKKIRDLVEKVLVTFGGTAKETFVSDVERKLKDRFGDGVTIVAPGRGKADAAGMLELMLDADICIAAGGQTTYELARVGVPTVCICFADNQRFNIKGLVDGGFLEYVGDMTDDDILAKIEMGINALEDREIRKTRSLAGRSLVPGEGAVNIFLKAAEVFGIKERA